MLLSWILRDRTPAAGTSQQLRSRGGTDFAELGARVRTSDGAAGSQ